MFEFEYLFDPLRVLVESSVNNTVGMFGQTRGCAPSGLLHENRHDPNQLRMPLRSTANKKFMCRLSEKVISHSLKQFLRTICELPRTVAEKMARRRDEFVTLFTVAHPNSPISTKSLPVHLSPNVAEYCNLENHARNVLFPTKILRTS